MVALGPFWKAFVVALLCVTLCAVSSTHAFASRKPLTVPFADTFIAGTPARLPHIRRVFEHVVAAAGEPDSDVWIALPREIAEAFAAANATTATVGAK